MVVLDIETEDGQREALRRILTIRTLDTKVADLFSDGELSGLVRPYIGEETVRIGACSVLGSGDYITSAHRGHGHYIAKGLDPDLMMAKLSGKADGYCDGKGGSMHTADIDVGTLGTNGVVGAGPSLATGAALMSHLKGGDAVALVFFGDGAAAQGQVHEAVNLVVTWSLPVVLLVESSQYGEVMPAERQYNVQNLSEAVETYNVPGFTVGGVDIIAAYEAIKEVRERAVDDKGSMLIGAETYWYYGHFKGNRRPHRAEEDVATWKDRDVIKTFERRLVDTGTMTEAEFDEMKAETDQQIEDAAGKMKDAVHPDPSEVYEDIFNATVSETSDLSSGTRADGGENR